MKNHDSTTLINHEQKTTPQSFGRILAASFLLALSSARAEGGKRTVAILDFSGSKEAGVNLQELQTLAETVRGIARKKLPESDWIILTRDNMQLRFPEGTDLSNCGDECVVTTGRRLQASYIVSGSITRLGSFLQITLSMYDVASADLKGSEWTKGKMVDDIVESLEMTAGNLFAPLSGGNGNFGSTATTANSFQKSREAKQSIAVLRFSGNPYYGDIKQNREFLVPLEDKVRLYALNHLSNSRWLCVSRDKSQALLPPDTNLSDYGYEKVLAAGRELPVDYIVTGEMRSRSQLLLNLYDVASGNLIGSDNIQSRDFDLAYYENHLGSVLARLFTALGELSSKSAISDKLPP
jgi:TolB-like protein